MQLGSCSLRNILIWGDASVLWRWSQNWFAWNAQVVSAVPAGRCQAALLAIEEDLRSMCTIWVGDWGAWGANKAQSLYIQGKQEIVLYHVHPLKNLCSLVASLFPCTQEDCVYNQYWVYTISLLLSGWRQDNHTVLARRRLMMKTNTVGPDGLSSDVPSITGKVFTISSLNSAQCCSADHVPMLPLACKVLAKEVCKWWCMAIGT